MKHIHLVGGGLVGSLAAIVLARRGCDVTLYDRRPDTRNLAEESGRSINLAVTARGLLALQLVGLRQTVLDMAVTMRGRIVHDITGSTTFIPYGQRAEEVIYSVSRSALNRLLLQAAGSMPNIDLRFEHRCTGYNVAARTLDLLDDRNGASISIADQTILATDGAGSEVRKSFRSQIPGYSYAQETLQHGYKELEIPAAAAAGFAMEKEALHIWPRHSFMLIALPNLNGSFTCTLFLSFDGQPSFAALRTPTDVESFFAREFPDAAALMPSLADDFLANPTSRMSTVRCSPWHVGDQVMLLGDAAHAIVPFFGQGMNCGFEDCTALDAVLGDAGWKGEWQQLFSALETERKPNADAIAALAVENFTEMRDTVADPKFQLKKQIGFELERRYPGKFIPRYSMVVFHPEISYAEARRRGIEQDKLLTHLTDGVSNVEQVNWQQAQAMLGTQESVA